MFHRCNNPAPAIGNEVNHLCRRIELIQDQFDSLGIPPAEQGSIAGDDSSLIDLLDRIERVERAFAERLEQRISSVESEADLAEEMICSN